MSCIRYIDVMCSYISLNSHLYTFTHFWKFLSNFCIFPWKRHIYDKVYIFLKMKLKLPLCHHFVEVVIFIRIILTKFFQTQWKLSLRKEIAKSHTRREVAVPIQPNKKAIRFLLPSRCYNLFEKCHFFTPN